jgi:Tol biopolymer transport system component
MKPASMFFLTLVLLFIGCMLNPSPDQAAVSPTIEAIATRTPSPSQTKTATSTATVTPTQTPSPTASPTPTPTATPLGGGSGRIAFLSNSMSNKYPSGWDIYTMNTDGSDIQLLIDDTDPISYFSISFDGNHIAYITGWVSLRTLKIANVDGTQPRVLVENFDEDSVTRFSWSPDSKTIAYTEKGDIHLISIDGKYIEQVTKAPEIELNPQWSSDGTLIAFVTYPERNLYLVDTDGTNRKPVTDTGSISPNKIIWSPDSQKIAFLYGYVNLVDFSTILFNDYVPLDWSKDSLSLYILKEREKQMLGVYRTDSEEYLPVLDVNGERQWINDAAWSPDEKLILLQLVVPKSKFSYNLFEDKKLYIYSTETKLLERLTPDDVWVMWASWIP